MPPGLRSKELPGRAARVTERREGAGREGRKTGTGETEDSAKGKFLAYTARDSEEGHALQGESLKQAQLATGTRKGLAKVVPFPGTDYPPPPVSGPSHGPH